ncbi:MAG: GNAT family N-acetyltransferase [Lachnospiraceae bacterium]|nr:GNAT family N-acetyltransferase [Lachnospiraceae bacterium]
MELIRAKEGDIKELVRISKEAFDSDVLVGATEAGGPPEYDNVDWHIKMMKEGHLFTAFQNDKIVGGIIIFLDENNSWFMYIGRIFVDPSEFRKGYGIAIMEEIEKIYPDVSTWMLDTPMWNVRTNSFYKKLGYCEKKREHGTVYYEKRR